MLKAKVDNRFTNELPADPDTSNTRRQVHHACFSWVKPTPVKAPRLLSAARDVAALFDWSENELRCEQFLNLVCGNAPLAKSRPYAMCYGGHQFGQWAGQLGDGRAINIGELINLKGERWAMQLKGAGLTPYSRTADGLAVLRSSIREYLCSEAMHHLNIPTTRALSLSLTGEHVMRDILYDGNPELEPGAIVCRVAPSFIRFGNFQIHTARKEYDELKLLADHTIRYHFPDLLEAHEEGSREIYNAWFDAVCESSCKLIVEWERVGFVHGVLNTDNMSILGLTIDFGPYGWLDNYDPSWTPNTSDAHQRRYRFEQQANVALWNLYQLANAIYPLIEETSKLETSLSEFQASYQERSQNMKARKLGLSRLQAGDAEIISRLEALMRQQETDFTLFYRQLAESDLNYQSLLNTWYSPEDHDEDYRQDVDLWLNDYRERVSQENLSEEQRKNTMNQVNPKFIFRNYLAQQTIDAATDGDYSMIEELLEVFKSPYEEQNRYSKYAQKRPEWAKSKVGCSMLSCSS